MRSSPRTCVAKCPSHNDAVSIKSGIADILESHFEVEIYCRHIGLEHFEVHPLLAPPTAIRNDLLEDGDHQSSTPPFWIGADIVEDIGHHPVLVPRDPPIFERKDRHHTVAFADIVLTRPRHGEENTSTTSIEFIQQLF
jgi:hypothetical protein